MAARSHATALSASGPAVSLYYCTAARRLGIRTVAHLTGWRLVQPIYGVGGFELLVALGDSPCGWLRLPLRGVAPLSWPRWGYATFVAAAYSCPQQSCETGISVDGVRASPPLWSYSILRGGFVYTEGRRVAGTTIVEWPAANIGMRHYCGCVCASSQSTEPVTTRRRSVVHSSVCTA